MYKTIISDLGGVFLNRGIWLFWQCLQNLYGVPVENGKTFFLKYYKQYFSGNITEEKFWTDFLKDINLNEDWKKLRQILLDLFQINKDVSVLYTKLKSNGYKMVLLSDQTKEWWPYLDKKLKVSSFFDIVIISALVGLNKPDPRLYKYALKESRSKPKEVLFIDDLEQNLIPATALKIDTILFENCKQLEKELANRKVL